MMYWRYILGSDSSDSEGELVRRGGSRAQEMDGEVRECSRLKACNAYQTQKDRRVVVIATIPKFADMLASPLFKFSHLKANEDPYQFTTRFAISRRLCSRVISLQVLLEFALNQH